MDPTENLAGDCLCTCSLGTDYCTMKPTPLRIIASTREFFMHFILACSSHWFEFCLSNTEYA